MRKFLACLLLAALPALFVGGAWSQAHLTKGPLVECTVIVTYEDETSEEYTVQVAGAAADNVAEVAATVEESLDDSLDVEEISVEC